MKRQRQKIEDAICSLFSLLRSDETTEAECQAFFETHEVVWQMMGFEKAVPHPSLPNEEGGFDYPDFLARHNLGRWEVIEIKTPNSLITKEPGKRRTNLRANAHDYLAQAIDYADRFSDLAVRMHFASKHGIEIAPSPRVRVIAGGGSHFDRQRIESDIKKLSHPVEFMSYADILGELHRLRASLIGSDENQNGLVFYLCFLPPLKCLIKKNQILTLGSNGILKSVELWMDDRKRIFVTIQMDDGSLRQVAAISSAITQENKPVGVMIEFIPCGDRTLLSMQVNGVYEVAECYEITNWVPEDRFPLIVGANIESGTKSYFDLMEMACYKKALPVDRRQQFWKDVYDSLRADWKPNDMRIRFAGSQFLRSAAHPNFALEPGCDPGSLVQPEHDLQPLSWPIEGGEKVFVSRLYNQCANPENRTSGK